MDDFDFKAEILGVDDVAVLTGLSRDDVYALFKRPDFPHLIPNKRKPLLVTKADLAAFLQGVRS